MWKDLFLDVVNVHAPLKKRRYRLKPSLPWINSSILHRIRQRDKFRRESLNRLRLLDEPLYYQHLYRQARSQVRRELAAAKSAFFQHTLASVKSNPREFWRLINKITRRKPVRAYSEPSSTDIADVFRSIVGKREPSCLPFAGRLGCSSNHRQFSFRHISPLEVELRLLHLNPRKADGCDGVQARFLMLGAPAVATSLAHIFNFSLAQGTFANEWKLAVVTPVFKKGDALDPANYRPISLLSTVSKVLEGFVFDQLYDYLEGNKLLPENQYGFRKRHSADHACGTLATDLLTAKDSSLCSGAVFLDISKAFDTVDHCRLLTKLKFYGLDCSSLLWFENYLLNRRQFVKNNGTDQSQEFVCHRGVPQGSKLGPLLFITYTCDLPDAVSSCKLPLHISFLY